MNKQEIENLSDKEIIILIRRLLFDFVERSENHGFQGTIWINRDDHDPTGKEFRQTLTSGMVGEPIDAFSAIWGSNEQTDFPAKYLLAGIGGYFGALHKRDPELYSLVRELISYFHPAPAILNILIDDLKKQKAKKN